MERLDCALSFNDVIHRTSVGKKYLVLEDRYVDIDKARIADLIMLLEKGVDIDGIISDREEFIGAAFYNKKVYDIGQLETEDILLASFGSINRFCNAHSILKFHSSCRKKVVVFGAGFNGERIINYLQDAGYMVEFVVDSSLSFVGKTISGVEIVAMNRLSDLDDSYTVILAGLKYSEMAKIVRNYNTEVNLLWYNYDSVEKTGTYWQGSTLSSYSHLSDKNIFVCGVGEWSKSTASLFRGLGLDVKGFLADSTDEMAKAERDGMRAFPIEDILYEDNYFVLVGKDCGQYERLKNMGLICAIDFAIEADRGCCLLPVRQQAIDVHLGQSYIADKRYPGFTVYGDDRDTDYKIVTLGGSATDGAMYPFKSWPEFLYENLAGDVTVYNGGVCGYKSGQELIKMLRDALAIEPNMIISYSGFNDTLLRGGEVSTPYTSNYMKSVVNFAASNTNARGLACVAGIPWKKKWYEIWVSNMEHMYAMAEQRGIRFLAFIQPSLMTKAVKTNSEKGLIAAWHACRDLSKLSQYAKTGVNPHDYIYDLTDIFDDIDNVYLDVCHVKEKGNELIAKKVLELIAKW